MEHELRLRIVLQKPPEGVDFGLQKGRGREYETVQKQRSTTKDLQFDFKVRAKLAHEGAAPSLVGPFVQGPPAARFVYVDIGTYAGQNDTQWSRRLKVPLTGIAEALINKAVDHPRLALEAQVAGTGPDGGPNCRMPKTLKWSLVDRMQAGEA